MRLSIEIIKELINGVQCVRALGLGGHPVEDSLDILWIYVGQSSDPGLLIILFKKLLLVVGEIVVHLTLVFHA